MIKKLAILAIFLSISTCLCPGQKKAVKPVQRELKTVESLKQDFSSSPALGGCGYKYDKFEDLTLITCPLQATQKGSDTNTWVRPSLAVAIKGNSISEPIPAFLLSFNFASIRPRFNGSETLQMLGGETRVSVPAFGYSNPDRSFDEVLVYLINREDLASLAKSGMIEYRISNNEAKFTDADVAMVKGFIEVTSLKLRK